MENIITPHMKICSQAISEALTIEKCSICLEKSVNTVLLWPCTHWFCGECIKKLHQSVQSEKLTCPLCKSVTSRRNILSFEEKQKEYVDSLQTLIGAISLDLGFDITSYRSYSGNENSSDLSKNKESKNNVVSPVRRAIQKTPLAKTRKNKHNLLNNQNKRLTRRSSKPENSSKLSSTASLPHTPNNPQEEKVKKWLETSSFSQITPDCLTENIVVDIHKPEIESPSLSEDQLVTLPQERKKTLKTSIVQKRKISNLPPDIEEIKVFDDSSGEKCPKSANMSLQSKECSISVEEEFDKLLPKRKIIKHKVTTYKSRNPCRAAKINFTVESDLFKSSLESENESGKSQNTLLDYSSGSGEEWNVDKETNQNKSLKKNQMSKFTKKTTKKRNSKSTFCNGNQSKNCNNQFKSSQINNKESKSLNKSNEISSLKKYDSDIINEIRNDWKESHDRETTKEFTSKSPIKEILRDDNIKSHITGFNSLNPITPLKHTSTRSPGWSRLKSTKKEFHMSEKKKLSLKTISKKPLNESKTNNTGISPLLPFIDNKQSPKCDNKTLEKLKEIQFAFENTSYKEGNILSSSKKSHGCEHSENNTTSKLEKVHNVNHSLSSASSGSPFNGFQTPEKESKSVKTFKQIMIESIERKDGSDDQIMQQKEFCEQNNSNIINLSEKPLLINSVEKFSKTATIKTNNDNKVLLNFEEPASPENKCVRDRKTIDDNCITLVDHSTHAITSTDLENSSNGSTTAVINIQENSQVDGLSKKRERDSGIHNDSGLCSPVKKRICRDVEVQTSPGRLQLCIKDILKTMLGSEAEEIFDKAFNKNIKNQQCSPHKVLESKNKSNFEFTIPNSPLKSLSQDSEKENLGTFKKNKQSNVDKYTNDSDLVLGTEDNLLGNISKCNSPIIEQERYLDTQSTKVNYNIKENQMETLTDFAFEMEDIDHNAITQPYKTPIMNRQKPEPLSSNLFSPVSNPTDSELKKVDNMFKNDNVYPDKTPRTPFTHWNESGVDKLEGFSSEVKSHSITCTTQNVKDNLRSKRSLDFIDEDSNDIFDVNEVEKESTNRILSDENLEKSDVKNDENSKNVYKRSNNDISHIQDGEKNNLDHEINGVKTNLYDSSNVRSPMPQNGVEDVIDYNPLSTLNEFGDDCIIEATPDVSQAEIEQENLAVITERENDEIPTPLKKDSDERNVSPQKAQRKEITGESPLNQVNKEIVRERIEYETAEEPEEEFCFASSLLSSKQTQVLMRVLNGLGIPFSKTVGPHITHLVVATTNGCTQNTYKFLYAMALHRPIIRYDWVEAVLASGETQPLEPYLALDPSGECGVIRAKKDKDRHLLLDFAIHVYNVNVRVVQKEQLEELIRLCGGTVVTRLDHFTSVSPHLYKVIILAEPVDASSQTDWRVKYSAAEVSIDWLYNTIGRYRVVPLGHYMIEPHEAVPFLLEQGYPEDLIFDNATQQ